jgi:D-glycero-alpha-D-manno-heptose-7-phosphate kinase
LARESCQIEIDRCGEPIGKQDQYAAAFGGFNFIRFNQDDTVEVHKVLCPRPVIDDLQSRLLFFYTGITRSASDLLRGQSASLSVAGPETEAMDEMVRMAETAYAEICSGNIEPLGGMLDKAWELKKRLSRGISNPLIDGAYAAARKAGAQGGKLLGAGGGGFLMFFAAPSCHDAIRKALQPLRETPFKFSNQGSSIIFVH